MLSRALDPALLDTFLTVLDASRISAAARTLRLSQPAVTAQVRRLEEAVSAPLFVRSARGVTPTDAGLRLAEYARAIRKLLDDALTEVAGSQEDSGPLVLAASTTIAAHVLPPILAQFRAGQRDLPVRLHVGNTEYVVAEVRAGRIPLGLVEGHARAPGVRLEAFVDDEIVPLIGRDTPFALRRREDLDRAPILWREPGSGTRAVVERALRKAGLHRRQARRLDLELGSTEAILGGAAAGLGVAFVSRCSARAHIAAGELRELVALDLTMRRTFHWALPTGALSGTPARFLAFARRQRGV
jgi:DNA-binding transcriptional LysR family regulator